MAVATTTTTTNMAEVVALLVDIKDAFWSDSFWLPEGVKWDDLKRNETVFYPDARDLYYPIPLAICLFAARLLWEQYAYQPSYYHTHFYTQSSGHTIHHIDLTADHFNRNNDFKTFIELCGLLASPVK